MRVCACSQELVASSTRCADVFTVQDFGRAVIVGQEALDREFAGDLADSAAGDAVGQNDGNPLQAEQRLGRDEPEGDRRRFGRRHFKQGISQVASKSAVRSFPDRLYSTPEVAGR